MMQEIKNGRLAHQGQRFSGVATEGGGVTERPRERRGRTSKFYCAVRKARANYNVNRKKRREKHLAL